MIGSKLRQALPLPLALAFAMGLLGGAYGYHGCPRHAETGHAGPDPERASAPSDPAADRPGGGHPAAPFAHETHGDDDGDEGASFCICIGACHAGAATVLAGLAAVELPLSAPGSNADPRAVRDIPPHELPAYFLPYALGPPAA